MIDPPPVFPYGFVIFRPRMAWYAIPTSDSIYNQPPSHNTEPTHPQEAQRDRTRQYNKFRPRSGPLSEEPP